MVICMGDLRGITILVITSGHEVTDHRVYAKQARSFVGMGAQVTIVGYMERELSMVDNLRVLSVPKPASRFVRFLWQPWRCVWKARAERPDLIHIHDAEILMTLPLAKLWWFRTKFVYDVHEDFANLMLIRDWLWSWMKPIVRKLTDSMEKAFASLADGIVGVTPPLAAKFKNDRSIVAYNFPAREFFDQAAGSRRAPEKREFDLVHVGTLNVRRAEFLSQTLREYHKMRPDARSLVLGVSQPIRTFLESRIPEKCSLIGKKAYEDIPALLTNARIGLDVHPWHEPHLEVALPVKVCEYMAAGCAVVSSAMPVLVQILNEAAPDPHAVHIIDGGSPADYAKAAIRLIEEIEAGFDPGSVLQEIASKYMVWEREATKIGALYLSLLQKPCAT